ncbi:MAG: Hydrolase, alpha/beta fold family [uncultured Rubrobacteraceae bacterium]|uniref:Hydrolase, alpha/beta fold family n=1 Tax=uncultured Rubrobacteraceae bacterium TaxID=349277 RepID=A0A6J4Q5Z9_9ACTN|nr:MAG: Hydrolase, alpha/beta fold family [uncultured Rubrobacteraceae bacterium]
MFEGFRTETVDVGGARIRARVGGQGPPLLLLHGSPQTLAMWHLVAPKLTDDFTVVATDLRGYGDSSKPVSDEEHTPYSKRTMAEDQVSVMRHFGFERFALCGHDRGGRVGYRMALDHPGVVTKLAVLDIIPTWEAFSRADMAFGMGYWHWFFLAQPFDLPERLLAAEPEKALFRGGSEAIAPEAMEEYVRCLRNPETIQATCEDYRAAATLDYEHDAEDREAGRRITCPLLALWGSRGFLEGHYDVLAVWRGWADDVDGRAIDSGHYIPEEAPEETLAEVREFFGEGELR